MLINLKYNTSTAEDDGNVISLHKFCPKVWTHTNVNLMTAPEAPEPEVNTIRPEGNMYVCPRIHGNPSNNNPSFMPTSWCC